MPDTPAPYTPLPWPGLPACAPEEMIARARAFYEAARTRRTCRFFAPDPVPREVIEYAIRAAGTAPSGANHQPEFRGIPGTGNSISSPVDPPAARLSHAKPVLSDAAGGVEGTLSREGAAVCSRRRRPSIHRLPGPGVIEKVGASSPALTPSRLCGFA